MPGVGAIPLGPLLHAVYDAGDRGACTVEIFSRDVSDSLYDSDLRAVVRGWTVVLREGRAPPEHAMERQRGSAPTMDTSNAELLRFYRDEVRFQSDLVGNRVDAFISSQSFLVLGYATAMAESIGRWHNALTLALPPALALLGIVLAFQAWRGIRAAYAVIAEWRKRESELLARDAARRAYTPATGEATDPAHAGGAWSTFREGALFARGAPWVFALAWCYFGALPVALYLRG